MTRYDCYDMKKSISALRDLLGNREQMNFSFESGSRLSSSIHWRHKEHNSLRQV